MRYENKFVYEQHYYDDVLNKLALSPFHFEEIYHERVINNIYLDTHMLSNYNDNMIGAQNREKHRIRWYGEAIEIEHPILEYKIKKSELGYKEFFQLPAFVFDDHYDYQDYLHVVKQHLDDADHRQHIMYHRVREEVPTLYNSYRRRYFLSQDQRYRVTIDTDLTFASIQHSVKAYQFSVDHMIIELKYEKEDVTGATNIMQNLGFRMTRNSKYVTGINGLFYNSLANY